MIELDEVIIAIRDQGSGIAIRDQRISLAFCGNRERGKVRMAQVTSRKQR